MKFSHELKAAKKAALDAGSLLRERFGEKKEIFGKGSPGDFANFVTKADMDSQKRVVALLKEAFPDYGVLSEEGIDQKLAKRWIIDPLDGTRNFTCGYPFFSVSVAFERNGEIESGVVYDPMRNELFFGERGKGAYMNDERVRVSNAKKLLECQLSTGFGYKRDEPLDRTLEYIRKLLKFGAIDVLRDGSAALDLCYVACGRHSGFWEFGLSPWDTAAGALLVSEAGGRITEIHGSIWRLDSKSILATNRKIHEEFIEVVGSEKW
ncbi:MAG: inositol monophosphatase [Candidatus Aenigmarchaeota archaeon]|nr:inositol monophosphatase [Candidatus Aenigmarchaeota archaeon]